MGSIVKIEDSLLYESECYNHRWIIDLVEKAIDEVSHIVTNTDKLQRRVMIYVGKYLAEREENAKNKLHIRRMVHGKIKESRGEDNPKRGYRVQDTLLYEGFSKENEEALPYEPPDILANVEVIIEQRDSLDYLIDSLARDDERARTMLTALASGYTEVETANILADVYGGKSTGHRSFIKRFKKKCCDAIS